VEVLIASSIFLSIIITLIPIAAIVKQEQNMLKIKREAVLMLHDELQDFLWKDTSLPATIERDVKNTQVIFHFEKEGKYVKGCTDIEARKGKQETICLYGISR